MLKIFLCARHLLIDIVSVIIINVIITDIIITGVSINISIIWESSRQPGERGRTGQG